MKFRNFFDKKLANGIYLKDMNISKVEKRWNQYWNILVKRLKLQKHPLIVKYAIGELLIKYMKKKKHMIADCLSLNVLFTKKQFLSFVETKDIVIRKEIKKSIFGIL